MYGFDSELLRFSVFPLRGDRPTLFETADYEVGS